jgi:hypothetical protein
LGKLIPGKVAWAASDQEVLACYLVRATKGLPQIEREWISFPERHCRKGLPLLRFRNHSTAKKRKHLFARNFACSTCFACTHGKPFLAERQTFGGKEPFWDTLILHVIQAQRMLTFLVLDTEIVS